MTELLANIPGAVTSTSLVLPANFPIEEWLNLIGGLKNVKDRQKWYLGDAILFGEAAYGERYAQALDATDYDYQQLRNIVWVCRNVRHSVRTAALSFSHHQAVAALEPELQAKWLEVSINHGLTSKQLKQAIKGLSAEIEKPVLTEYTAEVRISLETQVQVSANDDIEAERLAVSAALRQLSDEHVDVFILEKGDE